MSLPVQLVGFLNTGLLRGLVMEAQISGRHPTGQCGSFRSFRGLF